MSEINCSDPVPLTSKLLIFLRQYHEFLTSPGTLITCISGVLLLVAILSRPFSLLNGIPEGDPVTWIYLASALIGSIYIWYSAYLGIREHDFAADIPVSLAMV